MTDGDEPPPIRLSDPSADPAQPLHPPTGTALPVHDWRRCTAVERDAAGTSWVFRGSRVPIAALFEYLEDGEALSDFCEWFPDIPAEQVRAVLEHAGYSV